MRYVEVIYKCKCLTGEITVQVPERDITDDVAEWVRVTIAGVVGADHRARSPLCMLDKVEYVKIPADGDFLGQAKGGNA